MLGSFITNRLLYGRESESCINICIRTNFMLITVTQTNWPDMSEVSQRTEYQEAGQQLASTSEYGSQ